MAWIESHQALRKDPETLRLATAMGWTIRECIGALHLFWWWCVDYCEDGDLRRYNDGVLAMAVELDPAQGKRFVDAMTGENGTGFIEREPYFRVRNWWKFNSYRLKRKYIKEPAKWQRIEQSYNCHATVMLLSSTKPNQTKPTDLYVPAREDEPPLNPPIDPNWPKRIEVIHGWYCEQMGMTPTMDSGRDQQWMQWFAAGFEEDDFKRVLKYLRGEIDAQNRRPGALKLTNLLQVDTFREDLMLSKQKFNHGTNQRNNRAGVDRNAGTANEGKASQYRGAGKVGGVSHL